MYRSHSASTESVHSYDYRSQRSSRTGSLDRDSREVEQVVTSLLRTTKVLLETLTRWSKRLASPTEIYDIYNVLEQQFYQVVNAFEGLHISMGDLAWIPGKLGRSVNEAMSENPSPENFETYLHDIRNVIVQLLHGLKNKQQQLREQSFGPRSNGVSPTASRSTSISTPLDYMSAERTHSVGSPHWQGRLTQSDYDPQMGHMPLPQAAINTNDPSTKQAMEILKGKDDLKKRSSVRRASIYNNSKHSPFRSRDSIPPVPLLPTYAEHSHPNTPVPQSGGGEQSSSTAMTLFLQINDHVRKISYSGEVSMPALNMLFVETFGYSSRQNDFPRIYIRDPQTTITYELEHLEDVRDRSVLSLHPNNKDERERTEEALEKWKKEMREEEAERRKEWMDKVTEMVTREMAETRRVLGDRLDEIKHEALQAGQAAVAATEAAATATATVHASVTPTGTPAPATTTATTPTQKTTASKSAPEASMAGLSVADMTKSLQSYQAELQTLRRDVMVARQLEREMRDKMKQALDDVRQQSASLRLSDQARPSSARREIEEGKEKLLKDSDQITNRLEELQDTIDNLKLDVTQHKSQPSEGMMQHCSAERKGLADDIEAFGKYITHVKPRWKKTWEQELQTIVKEQNTLREQEGLLLDMKDDLEALGDVFEQLEKVCAHMAKARPTRREFRLPPVDEGFEGMASVLKQVATIDVDQSRRMRALEQADKMRQRELANRIDEFEHELTTFVDSNKLKKTGGAEEIDRLRDEKNKELLRTLFQTEKAPTPSTSDTTNEATL